MLAFQIYPMHTVNATLPLYARSIALYFDIKLGKAVISAFQGQYELSENLFAELGKMYDTKPGLYLIVGPTWQGELPAGFERVQYRNLTGGIAALHSGWRI